MNDNRIFNKIISVPAIAIVGSIILPNVKNYFSNNPFVSQNRVKAISIIDETGTFGLDTYITIVNNQNENLISNYPCLPLTTSNAIIGQLRLTYFDLINIDLNKSYWVRTSVTPIVSNNPFNINFYF